MAQQLSLGACFGAVITFVGDMEPMQVKHARQELKCHEVCKHKLRWQHGETLTISLITDRRMLALKEMQTCPAAHLQPSS